MGSPEDGRPTLAALKVLAATACASAGCPTTYTTDRDTVVVQGYVTEAGDLDVPHGEALVEIPRSLLLESAARIQDSH